MHTDNERIFPRRIVVGRVQQPTLNREVITGPVDGFGFTPRRLEAVIVVCDRLDQLRSGGFGRGQSTRPDLGRLLERTLDEGDFAVVGRERKASLQEIGTYGG